MDQFPDPPYSCYSLTFQSSNTKTISILPYMRPSTASLFCVAKTNLLSRFSHFSAVHHSQVSTLILSFLSWLFHPPPPNSHHLSILLFQFIGFSFLFVPRTYTHSNASIVLISFLVSVCTYYFFRTEGSSSLAFILSTVYLSTHLQNP